MATFYAVLGSSASFNRAAGLYLSAYFIYRRLFDSMAVRLVFDLTSTAVGLFRTAPA